MVQRAERNGFKAIILTADTPRLGRRELDIKNKLFFFFGSGNVVFRQSSSLSNIYSAAFLQDGCSSVEEF